MGRCDISRFSSGASEITALNFDLPESLAVRLDSEKNHAARLSLAAPCYVLISY